MMIMKKKKSYIKVLATLSVVIAFFCPSSVSVSEANDSAASLTPEGIQFKKLEEVSVEEEILYIRLEKIEVTYTFKNHSDKDIITDVTFPIPAINGHETPYIGDTDFDNFIVEVDGKKINYDTEKRAVITTFSYNENKPCYYSHTQPQLQDMKDVTDILRKMKIIDSQANKIFLYELTEESFDKLKKKHVPEIIINNLKKLKNKEYRTESAFVSDLKTAIGKDEFVRYGTMILGYDISGYDCEKHLTQSEKSMLKEKYGMSYCDEWGYSKKYYWKQKFPAGGIITVKHSYKPVPGWLYDYIKNDDEIGPYLDESCLDKQWCLDADMFRKWIKTEYHRKKEQIWFYEINYILTTAKNWGGPIGKFTLIVEKSPNDMTGFCFDGKVIRKGPDRFESTVYNFVPKADLSIIYISSERFR